MKISKDLYGKRKISTIEPEDPILRYADARDIAEAVVELVEENFGGLASVEYSECSGSVLVSEEHTTHLLARLFTYVFGRKFIKISFYSSEGSFCVKASATDGLPLSARESTELIKLAVTAGFDASFTEGELRLALKIHKSDLVAVYAPTLTKNSFRAALCKLFFD